MELWRQWGRIDSRGRGESGAGETAHLAKIHLFRVQNRVREIVKLAAAGWGRGSSGRGSSIKKE